MSNTYHPRDCSCYVLTKQSIDLFIKFIGISNLRANKLYDNPLATLKHSAEGEPEFVHIEWFSQLSQQFEQQIKEHMQTLRQQVQQSSKKQSELSASYVDPLPHLCKTLV